MLKLIMFLLLLPLGADAQAIIYTPGKAPVIVQENVGGYSVSSVTEGVTNVLDLGGFKMIQPPRGPSTYIIGDTPEVTPIIPLEPASPNTGLGIPTGPNNEYDM